MSRPQKSAKQLRQSQSQARKAMQKMVKPGGRETAGKAGAGNQAGTIPGQNKLGEEKKMLGLKQDPNTRQSLPAQDAEGKVIATWIKGGREPTEEEIKQFEHVFQAAKQDADRAVSEQAVPKRYHPAVEKYFQQTPTSSSDQSGTGEK